MLYYLLRDLPRVEERKEIFTGSGICANVPQVMPQKTENYRSSPAAVCLLTSAREPNVAILQHR